METASINISKFPKFLPTLLYAMNRIINHHVHDHQVPVSKSAAIFILAPDDLNLPGRHFQADLIRQSINSAAAAHREDSGVQCTTWKTNAELLLPAVRSLPRHLKKNPSSSLHVIFLCHGSNANLVWSNGILISTLEILQALDNLNFPQLDSVSLLSCNSLAGISIPQLSFDLIGFKSYIYWNELPFFSCRMLKEYCAGADLQEAVSVARKACKHSRITPFPKNSLLYRSGTKINPIN
jgi:hypothetical protein